MAQWGDIAHQQLGCCLQGLWKSPCVSCGTTAWLLPFCCWSQSVMSTLSDLSEREGESDANDDDDKADDKEKKEGKSPAADDSATGRCSKLLVTCMPCHGGNSCLACIDACDRSTCDAVKHSMLLLCSALCACGPGNRGLLAVACDKHLVAPLFHKFETNPPCTRAGILGRQRLLQRLGLGLPRYLCMQPSRMQDADGRNQLHVNSRVVVQLGCCRFVSQMIVHLLIHLLRSGLSRDQIISILGWLNNGLAAEVAYVVVSASEPVAATESDLAVHPHTRTCSPA